jgi:hypothetical protein
MPTIQPLLPLLCLFMLEDLTRYLFSFIPEEEHQTYLTKILYFADDAAYPRDKEFVFQTAQRTQ